MPSILFVCTGNICRSPTADAIMRDLVDQHGLDWQVDSVGTHGYHVGESPDPRTVQEAEKNGVRMKHLRARKLSQQDFEDFGYLYAMDSGHLQIMQNLAPEGTQHKLHLFLDEHTDRQGQDVPDPYYGGAQGFTDVFEMVQQTCEAIVKKLSA